MHSRTISATLIFCSISALSGLPRSATMLALSTPFSQLEVELAASGLPMSSLTFDTNVHSVELPSDQLTLGDCSLQQACVASGLGATPLTAAGLSAVQTATCLTAAQTAIAQNGATVQAAQNAYAALRTERDSLLRFAERGLLSDADRLRLAEVETSYSAAATSLQTACVNLRASATANLSSNLQSALEIVGTSPPSTPAFIRHLNGTEATNVTTRDAVANRRIATRAGQSFDPEAAPFALSTEHNDALSSFQSRYSVVREAWINSTR